MIVREAACPRCHKTWQVALRDVYHFRAREAALQGRKAAALCPECRRVPPAERRVSQ